CAPGGTAHKSGSRAACACFPFASAAADNPVRTITNNVVEMTLCLARQVCAPPPPAAIDFPVTECVFYTIPITNEALRLLMMHFCDPYDPVAAELLARALHDKTIVVCVRVDSRAGGRIRWTAWRCPAGSGACLPGRWRQRSRALHHLLVSGFRSRRHRRLQLAGQPIVQLFDRRAAGFDD